jgi:hypothetical protein
LLDDSSQELHAPVIYEYRDQIARVMLDTLAVDNRIQQLALLIGGHCGILPDAPQVLALGEQASDPAQATHRPIRVEVRAEDDISESAGVRAGDGSHVLVPALSGIVGGST